MPRITVAGGASNPQALPGEVGYIEPAESAPAITPHWVAEDGPELVIMPQGNTLLPAGWAPAEAPTPDYASMAMAELRAVAKERGLSAGGSKADLAARLAEHDAEGSAP